MAAAPANMTMEQVFTNFAKFGDSKSDGKGITLTNADKWMKQAHVIDGKKITTTDTGICFNKMKTRSINYQDFLKYVDDLAAFKNVDAQELKSMLLSCGMPGTTTNKFFRAKTLNCTEFLKYVEELAAYKKADAQELKNKLLNCGMPGATNVTQAVKVGGVDRLTDTSKYTGTHKERFDESGKGKGIEGREDIADNKGYVTGYKNADTYDKTHK